MPRVVPSDVTAIYPTREEVLPFILAASTLLDTYHSSSGLAAPLLAEMERWLTAHLMEQRRRGVVQRKLGDTSVTYDRIVVGLGLASTVYGQTVLALDSTGILATVGLKRATFEVF